jgi:hypothetical protein
MARVDDPSDRRTQIAKQRATPLSSVPTYLPTYAVDILYSSTSLIGHTTHTCPAAFSALRRRKRTPCRAVAGLALLHRIFVLAALSTFSHSISICTRLDCTTQCRATSHTARPTQYRNPPVQHVIVICDWQRPPVSAASASAMHAVDQTRTPANAQRRRIQTKPNQTKPSTSFSTQHGHRHRVPGRRCSTGRVDTAAARYRALLVSPPTHLNRCPRI